MDINRAFHVRDTADSLIQLADYVEQCGLTAASLGAMLMEACQDATLQLSSVARNDLRELSRSATSSKDFAAGLRRQANLLQERAACYAEAS